MGEWKEVELSAIAEVQTGPFGSQLHAADYVLVGVPVIMPNNIGQRLTLNEANMSFITEADASRLSRYKVKEGDIVFSRRGDVDKCILIDERKADWFCGTGCLFARINSEDADPSFVAYQFDGPELKNWLRTNAVGTTMPNLNSTILSGAPVALPDLSEQRAIASVLSSLDAKIDLLHRQNKTLEAMAETLFRQWFVEEAEEGWEEVRLGDYVGTNERSLTKDTPLVSIKYLDTGSITKGHIEGFEELALKDAPSRARRLVQHNDIIYSTVRPIHCHYGMVKNPPYDLVVSTGFCVVTAKTLGSHFVYYLLTTPDMTEFLHSVAEGSTSTYPSLKPSDIEAVEFQLPPKKRVDEFEAIASANWDRITNNYQQIKSLTALRDTLLPKLMSGEVRVENN